MSVWNVKSLFRAGALKNLIHELKNYKLNIAAVQEIWWKGNDVFDSDDYTVCCNGTNDRSIFEIGFLVHKKLKDSMMGFTERSRVHVPMRWILQLT
jgi:hypothetical protein